MKREITQVAVFTSGIFTKIESDMNRFLSELEEGEEVVEIKFSETGGGDKEWYSGMIIYKYKE